MRWRYLPYVLVTVIASSGEWAQPTSPHALAAKTGPWRDCPAIRSQLGDPISTELPTIIDSAAWSDEALQQYQNLSWIDEKFGELEVRLPQSPGFEGGAVHPP